MVACLLQQNRRSLGQFASAPHQDGVPFRIGYEYFQAKDHGNKRYSYEHMLLRRVRHFPAAALSKSRTFLQ
eukprot:scaffold160742_cov21-Prasinocladus_malaysianus.AAC.1